MKILIVGGGGREHALAWKCAQGAEVTEVFVAPGNAGTALEPRVANVRIPADDLSGLAGFAREKRVDLTIVGPEGPLAGGIVDLFTASGLRCFGPTQGAARLEASKAYCKQFLARHEIPTAAHASFDASSFDEDYVRRQSLPIVVKADGLAAGKGVCICASHDEAVSTARKFLDGDLGAAGRTIVIEEFLHGEEASFIVMAHGAQVIALATSQDHKRRDDGDGGPNTGGMGAYSPAPVVTPAIHTRIMTEVIRPTLRGLIEDGTPYVGFLYAGVMIAADGTPNVLEFNCRLGDPETQAVLMRLQSDLPQVCTAVLDGRFDELELRWDSRVALGVVMAAGGYPGRYRQGEIIRGLDHAAQLPGKIFHAGTSMNGHDITTAGGRVLCAVGLGADIAKAQNEAYALVRAVHWDGVQYRRDIGFRALNRS